MNHKYNNWEMKLLNVTHTINGIIKHFIVIVNYHPNNNLLDIKIIFYMFEYYN